MIKIVTTVISMLFVITLPDFILVHVILDTLAMGFHALISISHNRFETEVYNTILLIYYCETEERIRSNLDRVQFLQ